MKWVYEGVARSQEARLSDCFVNSISLKLRLILKKNLLCPGLFFGGGCQGGLRGWGVTFETVPHFVLFSTLWAPVKKKWPHYKFFVSSPKLRGGRGPTLPSPASQWLAICKYGRGSAGLHQNSELRGCAGAGALRLAKPPGAGRSHFHLALHSMEARTRQRLMQAD